MNPDAPQEEDYGRSKTMHVSFSDRETILNLTVLKLTDPIGIRLIRIPSFESLVNLKHLVITSVKQFPNNVCRNLETVTTNLECLEIGDCKHLPGGFDVVLKRLTNLTSLRLENFCDGFENSAQQVFCSIRGLDKLKILELINITMNCHVEDELEKCNGIKALLIIPSYTFKVPVTICHLIDCLKKLSNTLTHLVWGLTFELFYIIDLFIERFYEHQQLDTIYNFELSDLTQLNNNIPILKTKLPKQRPEIGFNTDEESTLDTTQTVNIVSVSAFQNILETTMVNTHIKVIKFYFRKSSQIYLDQHFRDL